MSTPKNPLADFAPKLVEITEKVLFGDVWERPQLSKRDRSLITCAALVALGKTEQMNFHFPRAIEKDLVTIANATEESVSVAIEEVPADDWDEKVYRPEILPNRDKLYKKPGYDRAKGRT